MNVDELREQVNGALKTRALSSLSAQRAERVTDGLSSGSYSLNHALSGNPTVGYAWGRIVEVYGPESSGKTTLALHAIAEAQKRGLPCAFVDAEHALDADYAENLGVDLDALGFSQPDDGEQALDIVEESVKAGFRLIVVDSVAALTPRAEIEGEMGEAHVGLQARLMSQACRKLTGVLAKKKAIVIFLNQIRMKIGVMFGNPETTPGGNALKFYTTYRLEIRSPRSGKKTGKQTLGYENSTEQDVETGTKAKIKVVKNKVYPPHRWAEVEIVYGRGIDFRKDAIEFLEKAGAFRVQEGSKGPVLLIPSKKKGYSKTGLSKVIDDEAVWVDVQASIKALIGGVSGDSNSGPTHGEDE